MIYPRKIGNLSPEDRSTPSFLSPEDRSLLLFYPRKIGRSSGFIPGRSVALAPIYPRKIGHPASIHPRRIGRLGRIYPRKIGRRVVPGAGFVPGGSVERPKIGLDPSPGLRPNPVKDVTAGRTVSEILIEFEVDSSIIPSFDIVLVHELCSINPSLVEFLGHFDWPREDVSEDSSPEDRSKGGFVREHSSNRSSVEPLEGPDRITRRRSQAGPGLLRPGAGRTRGSRRRRPGGGAGRGILRR